MHRVNDYLSDVGSKKAVSFMVPEKNGPPIVYLFVSLYVCIYQFQNRKGCQAAPLLNFEFWALISIILLSVVIL